jgi:hypothetical protein
MTLLLCAAAWLAAAVFWAIAGAGTARASPIDMLPWAS